MFLRALFLSVFVLVGCKARTHNETKRPSGSRANEFANSAKDDGKKQPITNLDALLPKLKAAGVVPTVAQWEYFSGAQTGSEARHIDVQFGTLTPEQCKKLKAAFADSWVKDLNFVSCENVVDLPSDMPQSAHNGKVATNRGLPMEFSLVSFLSPVMQATVGYTFNEEIEQASRPATDAERKRFGFESGDGHVEVVEGKSLGTNSWSTAYEVARQEKLNRSTWTADYDLYAAKPEGVEAAFLNPDNSTDRTQGGLSPDAFKAWVDKWGVSFGDILLVRGVFAADRYGGNPKMSLMHAAVFVDQGVVYERVGFAVEQPFRLADVMDVHAQYKDMDSVKFHVLRMKKPLPPAKEGESLDTAEMTEGTIYLVKGQLKSLSLEPGDDGVFYLESKAFDKTLQGN